MSLGTEIPMSIKGILRAEKLRLNGATRARTARQLEDALWMLWVGMCDEHGGEEAALSLWKVVSLDPSFKRPYWLDCRLRAHSRAILESVIPTPDRPLRFRTLVKED